MSHFENLFPENLYHSYIVEGDPETTSRDLIEFLKKEKKYQTIVLMFYFKTIIPLPWMIVIE